MSRNTCLRAAAAVVLFAALAAAAPAGVNLSHPFEVQGKLIPAGVYSIEETGLLGTYKLVDANGRAVTFITAMHEDLNGQTPFTLVFDQSGATPVLKSFVIVTSGGIARRARVI
jgi:hypothetical protein